MVGFRRPVSLGEYVVAPNLGVDATTLEANAAMRSLVRCDSGEGYEEYLRRLALESGIETPTREQLAKIDKKRKNKACIGSTRTIPTPRSRR